MSYDILCADGLAPRLVGTSSYRISDCGQSVQLSLEGIENPRDFLNLSGTLSVELWALSAPYSGENFEGQPLAGVVIDSIGGGQTRWNAQFDLPLTPPTTGTWTLVIMLREWTGLGYTTRDFVNFSAPVTFPLGSAAQPASVCEEAAAPAAPVAAANPESAPVAKPARAKAKAPAKAKAAKPAATSKASAAKKPAAKAKKKSTK